eukprot:6018896-Pyramimonas_sp.AAC.1
MDLSEDSEDDDNFFLTSSKVVPDLPCIFVDLPILSWVGGRVVVQPKRRKPQAIQPRRRKPQAKLDLNKRQRVLSTNATSINSSISLIAPDLSRGEDSSVSECN